MNEQEVFTRSILLGFGLCSVMGLLFIYAIDKLNSDINSGYLIFSFGIGLYIFSEIIFTLLKIINKKRIRS
jgi:hypothetical protein